MEIYIDADVDLINMILLAWLLIGLGWTLIVLRKGSQDIDDFYFISERLGMVILIAVIGWPYNLFCWIFSWPIWLTSVSEIFKRK